MRLRDLLDESVVKIGLESSDKEECFEEMVDVLVRAGRLKNPAAALEALRAREEEGSTGIGRGFAVPHGKIDGLPDVIVAMGTSRDGIEFDAVDDKPVYVVLMVLAGFKQPGKHLQALAEAARLIRVPGFYKRLAAASTPKELLGFFDEEE